MPHITLLAVFLAFFLGLAGAQDAQAAQADAPTPEEKLAKQLYLQASPRKARIPPLKEGRIRISGPLNSVGEYNYDGMDSLGTMRGCSWTKSRFGVMGEDRKGGGSAWFYADIDEKSGKVLSVSAYGNGACGRGYYIAFFDAAPLVGSFGDVEKEGFTLRASGPAIRNYQYDAKDNLEQEDAPIVITGTGDLLAAANGAKIPVKYWLGSRGDVVTEDNDPSGTNWDRGTGTVTVERYRKPDVIPTGKYVAPGLRGGAVIKRINDTTYSINVDIGDRRLHAASFISNQCHPEGAMLVCATEGWETFDGDVVPMNVRIKQVSPGKITLDADHGVVSYQCGASFCFDDIIYEKK